MTRSAISRRQLPAAWLAVVLLGAGLAVPGRLGAEQVLAPVQPSDIGFSPERLDEVTRLMAEFVEEGKISGAVGGIARRGRLAYLEAVGYRELETRSPMTVNSLFRIYSMTRAVTSVAVMILVEEGRLGLDDPVSHYLPAFADVGVLDPATGGPRPPSRAVTVRDLLLFTSGVNSRSSAPYREAGVRSRSIPLSQLVQNVVDVPLMEDPGTRYRYGVATTVAGAVVEAVSGQRFDRFLRERVLGPLGMTDTVFWADPERAGRLAAVYRQIEGGGLEPYRIEAVPFTEEPALIEGGVGLLSTVPDFMRFAQMLANGGELGGARILEPETVAEMTANGLSDEILATRRGGMGWGLGNVSVVLDPGSVAYPSSAGEFGWDGSAGTIFWINPEEELVIVLMWQSSPANPESLRQQIKTLIHEAIRD